MLKEREKIEGYIRRTRFLATYEKDEYDIAFYSKLVDQKQSRDRINQIAEKNDGEHNENLTLKSKQTRKLKILFSQRVFFLE